MSRRVHVLVLLAGMILAACGGGAAETTAAGSECTPGQVDGDLAFHNWTEYMDPEIISAFEAEYGVDVTESFFESNEALVAQIQSGVVYDVIVPSDYMVGIMISEGLLRELDRDAIPHLSNLAAEFADPAYDPGGVHSAAYQWGTTGLAVNTALVGADFEPSWALVFDPAIAGEYPAGVSLLNDPRETMGAALKYLGYSLNDTDLTHLQQAADVVSNALGHITAFDSESYTDTIANGEVAISHGFSGNLLAAIAGADNPDDFTYVIPEEGGTLWVDNMAIPVQAKSPCTAHTFVDFILDAENGAALSNWNQYASPNAAADEFLDPELLADPAVYPPDDVRERLEIIENTGDYEINFTDYFARAKG